MEARLRPIADLPRDAARSIIGVFCDIDDTLTIHRRVQPEAYSALCRAVDAGLRVLPVTGRPLGWAEVLAALWPVEAVIGEGGAGAALAGGGWLWWDDEAARLANLRRRAEIIAAMSHRLPWVKLAGDSDLRRVDVAWDIGEREKLSADQIARLLGTIRDLGASTQHSTVHAHAIFSDYDKARMSVRIAAALWGDTADIVRSRYLFVGDSPNDQACFSYFDHSIGVANVARFAADLTPPPRYVTQAAHGLGFAEAIDILLTLRR